MAEFEDWMQWKERCALGLCEVLRADRLAAYAHSQFKSHAGKLPEHFGPGRKALSNTDGKTAFHYLETFCLTRNPKVSALGKDYKEWIFLRLKTLPEGTPLSIVEKGASLVLRDAVRQLAAKELNPFPEDSGVGDDGFPSEQQLPDPRVEELGATYRAHAEEAGRQASRLFPGLTGRERELLVVRHRGLHFNDPGVVEICGVRKSQLFAKARELEHRIKDQIRPFVPSDGMAAEMLLLRMTWKRLAELVIDAARQDSPESSIRRLLLLPEEES
jgi:hypothetical protein